MLEVLKSATANPRRRFALPLMAVIFAVVVVFQPLLFAVPLAALAVYALLRFRYHAVLLVMIYLPFEDVVLKYAPGPTFTLFKFAAEGTVYLLFLSVIVDNVRAGRLWHRTPIDFALLVYLIAVVLSGIWNQVPAFIVVLANKNILRFVLMFYTVVHLDLDDRSLRKTVTTVFLVWGILSLIGMVEFFGGPPVDRLLHSEKDMYGLEGDIPGAERLSNYIRVSSTFQMYGEFGNYSMMLAMVAFGIYLLTPERRSRTALLGAVILSLICIVLTGSRTTWAMTYLGFTVITALRRPRLVPAMLAVPVVATVVLLATYDLSSISGRDARGANLAKRYLALFSAENRLIQMRADRGYSYTVVLPKVLREYPLLGLGPGTIGSDLTGSLTSKSFRGYYPEYSHKEWLKLPRYSASWLSDAGWASLIAQMGLLGTGAFAAIGAILVVIARKRYGTERDTWWRGFSLGFAAMVVAIFAANLTVPVFILRRTSSILWLLAAVLVKRNEQFPLKPEAWRSERSRDGEAPGRPVVGVLTTKSIQEDALPCQRRV